MATEQHPAGDHRLWRGVGTCYLSHQTFDRRDRRRTHFGSGKSPSCVAGPGNQDRHWLDLAINALSRRKQFRIPFRHEWAKTTIGKVRGVIERSTHRDKRLDVLPLSATRLQLEARLRDISVAVENESDVEIIHDLRITAIVSVPDLTILEIAGYADQQPYSECSYTAAMVRKLEGLTLNRGYRREVLALLGGTRGCSHFLTLALDLSATHVLSIYMRMRDEVENTPANRRDGTWTRKGLQIEPKLRDACFALRSDSPVYIQATDT